MPMAENPTDMSFKSNVSTSKDARSASSTLSSPTYFLFILAATSTANLPKGGRRRSMHERGGREAGRVLDVLFGVLIIANLLVSGQEPIYRVAYVAQDRGVFW
jgi:hypothetical protein